MSQFPGRIELLTSKLYIKGGPQFQGCNCWRSSLSPLPLQSAKAKQIKCSVGIAVHRLHLHEHI